MKRLEIGSYVYLTPPESKNGGEIVLLARQSRRTCEIIHANGLKDSCTRRDLNRVRFDRKISKQIHIEDISHSQPVEASRIPHTELASEARAAQPQSESWLNNNATVVIKPASNKALED